MDRCESYNGHGGPLASEVMAALYENKVYIEAVNYVYGLAGRDFTVETACGIFDELKSVAEGGKKVKQYRYVGLRTREGQ
jgi:pyruvate ferredoxin oxidoreductase alpha subunit